MILFELADVAYLQVHAVDAAFLIVKSKVRLLCG